MPFLGLFGPKTMPILLNTGESLYMMSLEFFNSLPLYVSLQRNKVSETFTRAYASVLKSDRRAVLQFEMGGHYFVKVNFTMESFTL